MSGKLRIRYRMVMEIAKRLGMKANDGYLNIAQEIARREGWPSPYTRQAGIGLLRKYWLEYCDFQKIGRVPTRKQEKKQKRRISDEFLNSYEWRKLRMQAIKKYGSRCMCCGASPKDGVMIHVDHIKPRKNYPALALDIDNLQILCEVCNHGKGNWDETDWRELTKEQGSHIKSILH